LATWKNVAPKGYELNAAAMLLHHLYTAIEAILERSLKTFDGTVPGGNASHIQLLEQASTAVAGTRGVILPQDDAIDELRRFRHQFRKRYDVTLKVDQLHPVIKNAVTSWPRIRSHLASFAQFVDKCVEAAQ
jgi:hypothetical protein